MKPKRSRSQRKKKGLRKPEKDASVSLTRSRERKSSKKQRDYGHPQKRLNPGPKRKKRSSTSISRSRSRRRKIRGEQKKKKSELDIEENEHEYQMRRSKEREAKLREQIQILNQVKKVFDSNKIPMRVRNRDKEKNILVQFMKKNLKKLDEAQPTLIITGQPGVGKTLLLKDMMKNFENKLMCQLSCTCHTILRKSGAKCRKIKEESKVRKAYSNYFQKTCICDPKLCESGEIIFKGKEKSQKNRRSKKNLKQFFKTIFFEEDQYESLEEGTLSKGISPIKRENKKKEKDNRKDIDFETIKSKISQNRKLINIMKTCFYNIPEDVSSPQDRRFKFFFFNSTLYSHSVDFLREILKKVISMFKPQDKNYILKKIKLSDQIGNVSLILTYIRKLLKFLNDKYFFVIIIDELDSLVKKDAKNFEFVVEFLNSELDNAVKIGVSNSYGLSNEVFNYKVQKDVARLIFAPYTEIQLKGIIRQRLKAQLDLIGYPDAVVVDDFCLMFLFKKYMKNSWGDIRFLLKIFQQIIEKKISALKVKIKNEEKKQINLEDFEEKENQDPEEDIEEIKKREIKLFNKSLIITIRDSVEIINSFFGDNSLLVVSTLSIPIKILLFTICQLSSKDKNEIEFKELKFFFQNNLKNYRNDILDKMETYLSVLESYNIISIQNKPRKLKKVKLSYSSKELVGMLKSDEALMYTLPIN